MRIIENPKIEDWSKLLQRPTQTIDDIENTVALIFDDVKRNGDQAISKYTLMFDGVNLEQNTVYDLEIKSASSRISHELKDAIQLAQKLKLRQCKGLLAGKKKDQLIKLDCTFLVEPHLYSQQF